MTTLTLCLRAFFLIFTLCAAFSTATSVFSALPVDYNGPEIHFTLSLDCKTDLCKSNTEYSIASPAIDCAEVLTADITWLNNDLTTVIQQRTISPFDFSLSTPFSDAKSFDNETVHAYIRVIKDKTCPLGNEQSAYTNDVVLTIKSGPADKREETVLRAKQDVATGPLLKGRIDDSTSDKYARAMLKVYPPPDTDQYERSMELSLLLDPIPDFNSFEQIQFIPTGLWQLASNPPDQLRCLFFYQQSGEELLIVNFEQEKDGNYFAYNLKIPSKHMPTIASQIIIQCITYSTTGHHYVPDLSHPANGLTVRYLSSSLQPSLQIESFVMKPLQSDKHTPQLQVIDLNTQVGPFNVEKYPYFSHGSPSNPIISRFAQTVNFDPEKPIYNSYYSFEYPVEALTEISKIDKNKDMFPCLVHEEYRFKFSTNEFAQIEDQTAPIPTIEDVNKQIQQAQFSVTCLTSNKGKYINEILYIGNLTTINVNISGYLTNTSLPQYPTITMKPVSQDEVEFKKYQTCTSYSIQIFLQLTSNTVPPLATRSNGVFMLENGYKYAASKFEPDGGIIVDSSMFSLSTVGDTVAKQRYVHDNSKNNPNLLINYNHSNNKIRLKEISFVVPDGNGDGKVNGKDPYWELALMSPGHFFVPETPSQTELLKIKCSFSPNFENKNDISIEIDSSSIRISGVNLEQNLIGKKITIKCDQKYNGLYIKPSNKGLPLTIPILFKRENVVTVPMEFTYQQNQTEGHFFRNVLLFLIILVAIFAVCYFGIKWYKERKWKKSNETSGASEGLEATGYNVPGGADGNGYANIYD
jgi:hypothetical protein